MREPGQSMGDTLLASWRTPSSRQQRTINLQVPHKGLRTAPIALMVESRVGTISVGGDHVAAPRNSVRASAAISPGS